MKFRRSVCAMAFALLLLNGRAGLPSFAQYQSIGGHTLSQTEAKELLKSASTPEDHLKLAEFSRDQAQQEEAASILHSGGGLSQMSDCKRPSAFCGCHISLLGQALNNPRARQGEQFSPTKEICMDAESRLQEQLANGLADGKQ
ncbi:MAG: hypothetical protein ACYDC6_08125 [Acidobacteriaceae bacterium]